VVIGFFFLSLFVTHVCALIVGYFLIVLDFEQTNKPTTSTTNKTKKQNKKQTVRMCVQLSLNAKNCNLFGYYSF